MLTPEERARQDLYNEYVLWRLELLHSNPDLDPAQVSDFDEWCEACNVALKKPKIKKRTTRARKKKQTAPVGAT